MKRIALWRSGLISVLILLVAGNAKASTLMEGLKFRPYVGWEFQYAHIKGNASYSQILPADLQYSTFFIGSRYHPNFGIEIAYYHTIRNRQSSFMFNAFNNVATSFPTMAIGAMTNSGFSFEWDAYFPLDPNFNIMALIGVVTYHPQLSIGTNAGGITNGGTTLAQVLSQVSGKNRPVLRLGAGLEYERKHWGARMRAMWDQTQTLHVTLNNPNSASVGVTRDAFKQALIVDCGVFYIF